MQMIEISTCPECGNLAQVIDENGNVRYRKVKGPDYRELLKKYMRHVKERKGLSNPIEELNFPVSNPVRFTAEEETLLRVVDSEC